MGEAFLLHVSHNDTGKFEVGGFFMKKKMTGTDVVIVCSILGIIACIVLIVDSFISGASKTLPTVLLGTCSANLCANVKAKRDNQQ